MEYKAQCGDIFLCDSNRTGAKIVKFLMTAPTIWQHVWRKIRGTQEIVRFYHAGMIISNEQMVEQQWKVQYADTQKILNRKVIIYRNKNITEDGQWIFKGRAAEDIGKTYDIPQLVGKTLTWLTGLKIFVRVLGTLSKEEEICVTRIGDWYVGICDFGVKTPSELTTKIVDEWCVNSKDWEIVYTN